MLAGRPVVDPAAAVATGRCERAVRATVRTGVDRIVLERGPADIVTVR